MDSLGFLVDGGALKRRVGKLEKVHSTVVTKGAQDPGLRISTLVNFISSDLIGGKTMEVIWAPIGGNIVGASVLKQVF